MRMEDIPLNPFLCETEQLRMHPLAEDDKALFHALYTDLQIMRFIGTPLTEAEAESAFGGIVHRQREPSLDLRFLAMVHKHTQMPLGICGTGHHDPIAARLEIGMVLLPVGRRLGIAREALTALVDRAFDEQLVNEVYACIAAGNTLARNLLSRVGFRQDIADRRQGPESTACHWSVHRSSWRTNQTAN